MLPLLALLACKEAEVVVFPGHHTDLAVTLVNPTSCRACDPFAGVDALRVDVLRGADVVASDTFAYPDEEPELPDLDGFGVVRIALVGLSGGHVVSAGRTPEVALVPDTELTVPMVFLPANAVLPLDAPMVAPRVLGASTRLPDGSILLLGGHAPARDRTFDSVERFDPATRAFEATQATLPSGVADPTLGWNRFGDLFITGGVVARGEDEVLVGDVSLWDGETETITEEDSLDEARRGHCLGFYQQAQGVALGGSEAGEMLDYLHPDDSGEWEFLGLRTTAFGQGDIVGCRELSDERVYVQGVDEGTTGIWEHVGGENPDDAFLPLGDGVSGQGHYARGATLLALEDGRLWIGGGESVADGALDGDAVTFDVEERRFERAEPVVAPRVEARVDRWILDDWAVYGCGWADSARETAVDNVELRDLGGSGEGLVVDFERARPGCTVATLPDGSVLVAGGYAEGEEGGADAAILVPWIEID